MEWVLIREEDKARNEEVNCVVGHGDFGAFLAKWDGRKWIDVVNGRESSVVPTHWLPLRPVPKITTLTLPASAFTLEEITDVQSGG